VIEVGGAAGEHALQARGREVSAERMRHQVVGRAADRGVVETEIRQQLPVGCPREAGVAVDVVPES